MMATVVEVKVLVAVIVVVIVTVVGRNTKWQDFIICQHVLLGAGLPDVGQWVDCWIDRMGSRPRKQSVTTYMADERSHLRTSHQHSDPLEFQLGNEEVRGGGGNEGEDTKQ